MLPHVSYETFSMLCVLLLDVCLVGHTGLYVLLLLFVGHLCAPPGLIDFFVVLYFCLVAVIVMLLTCFLSVVSVIFVTAK